jgi:FSR family fosmidomycin resistance protein-like MFS transporter
MRVARFALIFLLIEFLDEFVFGAREAAWPLIRADLGLTYAQIGLLLSVPNLVSNLIEPFLAILGDVWRRRVLVLGGGVIFAGSLLLTALSRDAGLLMVSFITLYPASGAFVSLSQATLMDLAPARREQNMARWTFAGSVGVVGGPLALAAAASLGLDWRGLFVVLALLTLAVLAAAWRVPYDRVHGKGNASAWPGGQSATGVEDGASAGASTGSATGVEDGASAGASIGSATGVEDGASTSSATGAVGGRGGIHLLAAGLLDALAALRRGEVWRWLILLDCADLLLDVLLGFLALYMVDVAGATVGEAAMAVAVWTGVGLVGDLLLIPLLERVAGLRYLRVSAAVELILFPAFLLAPGFWPKLTLLAALGFFNAGWYAILQAQLYAVMPGQSGTALAVKNVSGLAAGLIPLALGLIAQRFGLEAALWFLLLGPLALLLGLPRGGGTVTG